VRAAGGRDSFDGSGWARRCAVRLEAPVGCAACGSLARCGAVAVALLGGVRLDVVVVVEAVVVWEELDMSRCCSFPMCAVRLSRSRCGAAVAGLVGAGTGWRPGGMLDGIVG
jgi:hypothetical protein